LLFFQKKWLTSVSTLSADTSAFCAILPPLASAFTSICHHLLPRLSVFCQYLSLDLFVILPPAAAVFVGLPAMQQGAPE
jgi:hypothetical protein